MYSLHVNYGKNTAMEVVDNEGDMYKIKRINEIRNNVKQDCPLFIPNRLIISHLQAWLQIKIYFLNELSLC